MSSFEGGARNGFAVPALSCLLIRTWEATILSASGLGGGVLTWEKGLVSGPIAFSSVALLGALTAYTGVAASRIFGSFGVVTGGGVLGGRGCRVCCSRSRGD